MSTELVIIIMPVLQVDTAFGVGSGVLWPLHTHPTVSSPSHRARMNGGMGLVPNQNKFIKYFL